MEEEKYERRSKSIVPSNDGITFPPINAYVKYKHENQASHHSSAAQSPSQSQAALDTSNMNSVMSHGYMIPSIKMRRNNTKNLQNFKSNMSDDEAVNSRVPPIIVGGKIITPRDLMPAPIMIDFTTLNGIESHNKGSQASLSKIKVSRKDQPYEEAVNIEDEDDHNQFDDFADADSKPNEAFAKFGDSANDFFGNSNPNSNDYLANQNANPNDYFANQNTEDAYNYFANSNEDNNLYSDLQNHNDFDTGFEQPGQIEEYKAKPKTKLTGDDSDPETPEELKLIEAAQRDQQERFRKLREKEDQETTEKRSRKAQAQKELNEWYAKK